VTLEDALAELPGGRSRTIVKVDAEGSECEILARPTALERVDVLLVEWHSKTASCSREMLIERVTAAGFELIGTAEPLRFERR